MGGCVSAVFILVGCSAPQNGTKEPKDERTEKPQSEIRIPQSEIEMLIQQLGDDDWEIREKAQGELIKLGETMLKQYRALMQSKVKEEELKNVKEQIIRLADTLHIACNGANPEIKMRSKLILEHLWGLTLSPDVVDEQGRVIINIVHKPDTACEELKVNTDGQVVNSCQIKEHWKIIFKGKDVSQEKLLTLLTIAGDLDREPPTNPGEIGLSKKVAMIRAEFGGCYVILQQIMFTCARAKIWKIEVGAAKTQTTNLLEELSPLLELKESEENK
jgi:hypothetical protein